jgi:hypothetical protein
MARLNAVPNIILICRLVDVENQQWCIVSNMHRDGNFNAAKVVMTNDFNEYMSYVNCGVEYRFIRKKDLSKYIPQ